MRSGKQYKYKALFVLPVLTRSVIQVSQAHRCHGLTDVACNPC